jgi:hypothetical protein
LAQAKELGLTSIKAMRQTVDDMLVKKEEQAVDRAKFDEAFADARGAAADILASKAELQASLGRKLACHYAPAQVNPSEGMEVMIDENGDYQCSSTARDVIHELEEEVNACKTDPPPPKCMRCILKYASTASS